MNHKLSLLSPTLVKCNYKRKRPYTFQWGQLFLAMATHQLHKEGTELIILGGNTPSREDSKRTSASRSEILTLTRRRNGVQQIRGIHCTHVKA